MTDLGSILDALRSDDAKERRRGFSEAEAYLDSEDVEAAAAPELVDALLPSLSDSNPKFAQGALDLLIALVEVMGEDLQPFIDGVWKPLVERLFGDAKVANRERAVDLAVALSTLVVPGSAALERIRPAWDHKNWRARESSALWFSRLLAAHDSSSSLGFPLRPMLPTVVKLLEDREPPVREAAFIAVEQMHRHLGAPPPPQPPADAAREEAAERRRRRRRRRRQRRRRGIGVWGGGESSCKGRDARAHAAAPTPSRPLTTESRCRGLPPTRPSCPSCVGACVRVRRRSSCGRVAARRSASQRAQTAPGADRADE